MRALTCLVAAGLLAASAMHASAANVAYGEAFDTLYRIDLETRQATGIGVAGRYAGQIIGNISGLTTAADGAMYAVSGASKLLLKVDPGSGQATVIGRLDVADGGTGQFDALDLNMVEGCDGKLWLSSGVAEKLWTVDRASGATTLVGTTGHTITGLVAYRDKLFGAGSKGDNNFYRIDRATGAATPIGPFGPGVTRWVNSISMSFDDQGVLWAVLNYVPPQDDNAPLAPWSDLAKIDPNTGTVTVLGPITGPESLREVGMKGFTAGPPICVGGSLPSPAPIGSPWALGLLALLLGLAAAKHPRAFARSRAR